MRPKAISAPLPTQLAFHLLGVCGEERAALTWQFASLHLLYACLPEGPRMKSNVAAASKFKSSPVIGGKGAGGPWMLGASSKIQDYTMGGRGRWQAQSCGTGSSRGLCPSLAMGPWASGSSAPASVSPSVKGSQEAYLPMHSGGCGEHMRHQGFCLSPSLMGLLGQPTGL